MTIRVRFFVASLVLACLIPNLSAAAQEQGKKPAPAGPWAQVARLIEEQKMQQALEEAEKLLAAARSAGEPEAWTRALLRTTQLRIALHTYKEGLISLRREPWPSGPIHQAALRLFEAYSIVQYYQAYSWEINQRERVQSSGSSAELDLDRWTREQLFAEAVASYIEVWKEREALGKVPVSRLAEYLEPNNYPAEVRGTLRDAVSYLFAELLAHRPLWTPRQDNAAYRLDLPRLAGGKDLAADEKRLADPAVHPLEKLAAVLADLEAWHAGAGNRAGALEAHLQRVRWLGANRDRNEDKAFLEKHLEEHLAAYRDIPWWSKGMADRAELLREQGDLVRAHGVAVEGYEAYPDSPGGAQCLRIAREIDAPDFQVSAMAVDGPGERSLLVTHKNLPALYFRAYRTDLRKRLTLEAPSQDGARQKILALLKEKPVASWTVDLPTTFDFQYHRTFVTPPLDRRGAYRIAVSTSEDFDPEESRILEVELILSDLVLVTRPAAPENRERLDVLVLSGETGRPVAGVEVQAYSLNWNQRTSERVATGTSNAEGAVRLTLPARQQISLLATKGEDATWQAGLYTDGWYDPSGEAGRSSFVYTDRTVYRPQQKVFWKVLAFQGKPAEGQLQALTGTEVKVALVDPNGESVAEQTATTGKFGTASGELSIPPGRPLGGWRVVSSLGGEAYVQVEEYKRPTFEVTLEDPAEALRLNRPAVLQGKVGYYFGLPVTEGEVTWTVRRQALWNWWNWRSGEEVVASGTSELRQDGSFRIEFTPEADEREAQDQAPWGGGQVTYLYRVSAAVTDEGGETRETERSFRLGWTSVEVRIDPGKGFWRAGQPAKLTVTRSDLNGAPRPGEGQWTLVELRQPEEAALPADLPPVAEPRLEAAQGGEGKEEYRTPGDLLRPRWDTRYVPESVMASWPDGRTVTSGSARHGADGQAEVSLPANLAPGAYRLKYETVDDFGARVQVARELIVTGEQGVPLKLAALLRVEDDSVAVGGTARLLVGSGLPGQTLFLEIYRAGRLSERRRLSGDGKMTVVEIPIRREDRGGFGARLLGVRDHQLLTVQAAVQVPWNDRRLAVEFSTFREELRPGGRETWRVTVKSADGSTAPEALAAEVLAYMYDRSLDAIAPHTPPDPMQLYPDRTGLGEIVASLGEMGAHEGIEGDWRPELPDPLLLRGDRLRILEGWGIGGLGRFKLLMRQSGEGRVTAEAATTMAANVGAVADTSMQAEPAPAPAAPPPPPPPPAPAARQAPGLRQDFSETAFWKPQLLTGPDGSAAIEFTLPDSVTSWSVWVHAVSRDLRTGSARREARTVRELMVRPYLPRFLREGDQADLKVVVNNASKEPMRGEVAFDIVDPETGKSLLAAFGLDAARARRPFSAEPGAGADLTFPVTAPGKGFTIDGPVHFRVTATAGDLSDGELRPLPILPSRLHLAQSRFAALRNGESRTLRFEDLEKGGDPTRETEQLVVTLDGQLFYSVLEALPYLVNYPYECTEQTLNRFLSTGIVSSLFDRYPSVARMAQDLAKRETPYEAWDAVDPNRRMALEETPWLDVSRGGKLREGTDPALIRVLDPRVARAERATALAKLRQAQHTDGAFPWWPGGPPSPYMTLYLLYGFAKATEHEVEVPQDMVQKAWGYLARYYRTEHAPRLGSQKECCFEFLTFLNYVGTAFPDASWTGGALTEEEQKRILDASFRHWKEHSPYLKAMLALTLKRKGRAEDARLVFDSIMDSAKTTPEEGTFWQPEARSWLWYNDTIESHAFALRALTEIAPKDPRRHGLVQWLFLNKQLNHWKSTRATAEVLYALVHYLEGEGQLGSREVVKVRVSGREESFVFEPDRYTGKHNQVVVPGEELDPARSAVVVDLETPGLLFASATWHFSTEELPKEERGDLFGVSRRYFRRVQSGEGAVLQPLADGAVLAPGDEVEVQLTVRSRAAAEYVHLRDPRPAGFEPGAVRSGYRWDLGLSFYEETRDSGTNFFFEWLPAGEYTLRYRVRANVSGTFRSGPATLQSMYAPEFTAYSTGERVKVE